MPYGLSLCSVIIMPSKFSDKAEMCSFLVNVVCSIKLDLKRRGLLGDGLMVMDACFSCEHYKTFVRDMEEEEAEFFEFEKRVRKNPQAYIYGELE